MAAILIVDDDPWVRKLLLQILEPPEHACVAAENAAAARRALEDQSFELVLCDINMPGESGLAFARFLATDHPDTAVVMITGEEEPQVVRDALEIGVYDYILKPLEPNRVRVSVTNVLRRRQLEIGSRNYQSRLETQVTERTRELQETVRRLEQTQVTLEESEAKYREFVQQSGSIMLKMDTRGRVIAFNEFAQTFFGYSEDEILNQSLVGTIVSPEDASGRDLEAMIQDIIREPHKYAYNENENICRNGKRVWVSWSNKPLFEKNGRPRAVLCIGHDITSRKQAEQAMIESEEKFRTISACAQDAIIMMDEAGRISYWNPAAERIFGFTSREAMGKDLHGLIVPAHFLEDFQQNFPNFQETGRGGAIGQTLALIGRSKDDKEIPIEVSLSAIQMKNSWHALGLIRDVSERKVLETQLVHAQKMESIGQLAAGIAHEINTPTQYVGHNVRFLQDAMGDMAKLMKKSLQLVALSQNDGQTGELIEEMQAIIEEIDLEYLMDEIPAAIDQSIDGVDRVATIVRAMKEFSHPGVEEKTEIDLNRAIASTITVARNEWKYVAEMTTEFDPGLPPVPCLPGDLNQVILNLIINAAHAIKENLGDDAEQKGAITVSTQHNGQWAEIRIADTGTGIAAENRDRIFDPFFTTKEVGKGTGQGLAISHSVIVDKHAGSLDFETEPGKGTTFIIRLPLKANSQAMEAEKNEETNCICR